MTAIQAHMHLANSLTALVHRLSQSGDVVALAKARAALAAFPKLNKAEAV
ncbi:MAG: hypothetical protein KIG95_11920 [Comamonas sp.]|nr:hypothetical protein [Comamonas sp.]